MARPRKQGLQSFALDVDCLSDEKVISVTVAFGARGFAVLVALLCAVYRNGYFALWNDALACKVVKELGGIDRELVAKVVEVCVKTGLFDRSLFESNGILTSSSIQRRYFAAARRRVLSSDLPFLLVSAAEMRGNTTETAGNLTRFFADGNRAAREALQMQLHIGADDLRRYADEVIAEWTLSAMRHADYSDWARHLISTIRIKHRHATTSATPGSAAAQRTERGRDYAAAIFRKLARSRPDAAGADMP